MSIRTILIWLVIFLLTGCGAAESVRKQVRVANENIAKVKEVNPQHYDVRASAVEAGSETQKVVDFDRCRKADKNLAYAEAHARFTEKELAKGCFTRAEYHVAKAVKHSQGALSFADGCKPFQVTVLPIQEPDRDGDGVPDRVDKCPDVAGLPELDGCPEIRDTDGDGIPDNRDQCPNDPEDFDGDADEDGCPDILYDRDGDGIPDDIDSCPDVPEDLDGFADEDGCPDPDNDNDGIPDTTDKCPNQPEDLNGYMDEDGCPEGGPPYKLIVIDRKGKRIELKQKIFFDFAKATIKPESHELLNEVAQALKDNPGMEVLIEGHTDNIGSASYNMRLSQARADSVRKYIIEQGIEPYRLEAVGYGLTKPIAPNTTAAGRDKNRRVEFKITKQPPP